jgi:hypothetical protein
MENAGAIRATAYIADPRNLARAMGLGIEFSYALAVRPQHAQGLRQAFDRPVIDRHMDVWDLGSRLNQSLHQIERQGQIRKESHVRPLRALGLNPKHRS